VGAAGPVGGQPGVAWRSADGRMQYAWPGRCPEDLAPAGGSLWRAAVTSSVGLSFGRDAPRPDDGEETTMRSADEEPIGARDFESLIERLGDRVYSIALRITG